VLLFEGIFPVLALALAGYAAARSGWLQMPEYVALSRFTFNLVIPCLLFINMAHAGIPANFGVDFLLAFYLAVISVYVIAAIIAALLFKANAAWQAVFAMSTTYSNTTVVGIPLVMQTLGEQALLPLFLIIATQNLVLFSVGTVVAEREHFNARAVLHSISRLLKQLLGSPLTASLLAGLAVNLLGIPIYAPLDTSLSLMSQAAIPCALFVLGTTLHQYRVGDQLKPALLITALKLVLLPTLMAVSMLVIFDIDPLWAKTAILGAAMPVGISAYVFSIRYDIGQAPVAAASVISTLASLLPLTLVLVLLP